MQRLGWGLIAALFLAGCGSDDPVSPTPDLASEWVGEYEGVGDYALSNGQSGAGAPTTLSITQATPKEIIIAANLTFGTGRNDFIQAFAIVAPEGAEAMEQQYRQGTTRIAIILSKENDTLTGVINTSTLRINGNWTTDSRLEINVVRQ